MLICNERQISDDFSFPGIHLFMAHVAFSRLIGVIVVAGLTSCRTSETISESSERAPSPRISDSPDASDSAQAPPRHAPPVVTGKAELGKPAPLFSLLDEAGKTVSLTDYRGKIVVLEWFNPFCPFVKASHERGSMKPAIEKAERQGAVWLAVNSAGPGKQGHEAVANAAAKKQWNMNYPALMDATGEVGRAYGAQRTPHMFVIDSAGILVYMGAIDNSPDGDRGSPKDGVLVSHVEEALEDIAMKRAVRTASTEAYGCTVKYGGDR
ncbi:MAG TPA: redoxin domain-containing protein [Polyangiaceae bacterium]|nr:redoxin domain-containing protein [Polyangiaceae bacterium]